MIFDDYLFADYSGAASPSGQRKTIQMSWATQQQAPQILKGPFTRASLITKFVGFLRETSRDGRRVCFGQDHQYGIPAAFAAELTIHHLSWREAIAALVNGSYDPEAPRLSHPATDGAALNAWLMKRDGAPYFYSATKTEKYRVPKANPRPNDISLYRLTERCRADLKAGNPKTFNRIGDQGSVGGQSLLGIAAIHNLLQECKQEGIPVAVWPFDGLDILSANYVDRHVMVEPYPTAVRDKSILQSDIEDARGSAAFVRGHDLTGDLQDLLNLEDLTSEERRVVSTEGWILGHRAKNRR